MRLLFVACRQTDFELGLFVHKLEILACFWRIKPETMNKDCWHLMEAIGIAIWELELHRTHISPLQKPGSSKKNLFGISLDFRLPYQLCYSLIHYCNISTNFEVFSIQWYQWYAFPGFWAWVTGSLLWTRQSDRKWRKIDPSLKKLCIFTKKTVSWATLF